MSDPFIEQFVADRDAAMTAFIMNDDWDALKAYCNKYAVAFPERLEVAAAGVYKAAQEIINLPQEVKDKAREKCIALGFSPKNDFIRRYAK